VGKRRGGVFVMAVGVMDAPDHCNIEWFPIKSEPLMNFHLNCIENPLDF